MGEIEFYLLMANLLGVAVFWVLPRQQAANGAALVWAITIAWVSLYSAIWLAFNIVGVWAILKLGQRTGNQNLVTWMSVVVLAGMLLVSRPLVEQNSYLILMGGAYFTLRSIHVVLSLL